MILYRDAKEIIDSNLKTMVPNFQKAFYELENGEALLLKVKENIIFYHKEEDKLYIYMLSGDKKHDIKIESNYDQLASFFQTKTNTAVVVKEFSERISAISYEDSIAPTLQFELTHTPITEEAIERIATNIKLQLKQAEISNKWVKHMKIYYDSFTQLTQISIGSIELEYDLDGNNVSAHIWDGKLIEPGKIVVDEW